MAEYVVISCSLRPASFSRVLAHELVRELVDLKAEAALVDLRDYPLPFCDGESAYDDPRVDPISEIIRSARVLFLAVPVYNFQANAVVKNLIELTGSAWEGKIVGFLCAAGGDPSYMSIMSLANSLMLDFRCVIIPRFVYATGDDFEEGTLANSEILRRVRQLATSAIKLHQN